MTMIVCNFFFLLSMPLLIAPIVKNSHILAGKHFIFLERSRPNLKDFQYEVWNSVK